MLPQYVILESTHRPTKDHRHKRKKKVIIGNKVEDGMLNTSMGTFFKGNRNVMIILRGFRGINMRG